MAARKRAVRNSGVAWESAVSWKPGERAGPSGKRRLSEHPRGAGTGVGGPGPAVLAGRAWSVDLQQGGFSTVRGRWRPRRRLPGLGRQRTSQPASGPGRRGGRRVVARRGGGRERVWAGRRREEPGRKRRRSQKEGTSWARTRLDGESPSVSQQPRGAAGEAGDARPGPQTGSRLLSSSRPATPGQGSGAFSLQMTAGIALERTPTLPDPGLRPLSAEAQHSLLPRGQLFPRLSETLEEPRLWDARDWMGVCSASPAPLLQKVLQLPSPSQGI